MSQCFIQDVVTKQLDEDAVSVRVLQEARSFPESYPPLPKQEMVESSLLQKHVLELAAMLDVQNLFSDGMLDNY